MNYSYSAMLKAPGKAVNVDLEKPAVVKMMKAMCRAQMKHMDAAAVLPDGVMLRKTEMKKQDGDMIVCFVLEPEADLRREQTGAQPALPAMIYLHGGAYALPVSPSALALAAVYAKENGMRVFVPEYRLLPEYSGFSALADCRDVWELLTVRQEVYGVDAGRLLLYGESAGGALAAGLTALLLEQKQAVIPAGQLLIYPALDQEEEPYPSKKRYEMAAWPAKSNRSMWKAYLSGAMEEELPYLIPMQWLKQWCVHERRCEHEYPATYVEAQEIDILKDEAAVYAGRLQEAGADCTLSVIEGSYHGYDSDLDSPLVQSVLQERIQMMQNMLKAAEIK